MAYWDTRQELLDYLISQYYWADYTRKRLAVNINNAAHDLGEGDIAGAVGWVITSLFGVNTIFQYLIGRQGAITPSYNLIYYLSEYTGAEITWKSICEAWVKDDFEGRFWTIGIIDRMRQILWNEPFDLTWAARPEAKGI